MNLSSEDRLLLYCVKTDTSEATEDQIKRLISSPLNWKEVLEAAFWHRIAPLMYHTLKDIKESQFIPQEVMDRLKGAYHRNMAKNMYFYSELRMILDTFHEKGIKVIVLKGAALAETVYGNIALRPMEDIDLLVKKEDLPNAEKTMSDLGYIFQGDESPEWYRENHFHISYIHPERTIPVEIHWHIGRKSHPSKIAITEIGIIKGWWERAQSVEVSGKKALVLCPDDLIFHLSLHFFKHRFMSESFKGTFTSGGALIQLSDIVQTLRHYREEINWARLKFEAEKYGVTSLIYSTLYIVEELMGSCDVISRDIQNEFTGKDSDKELVELIKKRILIREENTMPASFFRLLAANTFQKKLKILLSDIFPHPETLSKRYSVDPSSWKIYFYYLFHPLIVLLKYRNLIWKALRSREELKEEVMLNRWINSKNR